MCRCILVFFCFKQKKAYYMRISYWSSDVGSSDLLTAGGSRFVTPLSLGALSEDKVYTDLFSLTDEQEMGHIRLSREADLLVVAPASADILARMAAGLAGDQIGRASCRERVCQYV